jgi:hypothetical protein
MEKHLVPRSDPHRIPRNTEIDKSLRRPVNFPLNRCWVNKPLPRRAAFEQSFQRDRRQLLLSFSQIKWGWGNNTMPRRPVVAATMIVAASLIGITQARLPRAIRNYRDRVTVETSASDVLRVGTLVH